MKSENMTASEYSELLRKWNKGGKIGGVLALSMLVIGLGCALFVFIVEVPK